MLKSIPKIYYALLTLAVLLLSTCKENEIYPEVPSIKFKDAYVLFDQENKDSLIVVVVSYKDGDGDIGLAPSDTFAPYNYVPSPLDPKKGTAAFF